MIYNEKAHVEKIAANRATKLATLHGTTTGYSYYKCRCPRMGRLSRRRGVCVRDADKRPGVPV